MSNVKLSNSIKEIGWGAFSGCQSLEEIVIPEGVKCIGNAAFENCGIKSISIPDSVTKLGYEFDFFEDTLDYGIFESCDNLSSVKLPKNINTIKSYLFKHCKSLASIDLPDNITTIEKGAFYNCDSLKSIELPDSVVTIEGIAFSMCESLETIKLSENLTSIGESAFYNCSSLVSVKIPPKISNIKSDTFYRCKNLISVELSEILTDIGYHAFYGCDRLTTIKLPESLTTIDNAAFMWCISLESIELPSNIESLGAEIFKKCTSLEVVKVPKSVKSIGNFAFSGCTSLKHLIVEKNSYAEQYAKEQSLNYIYASNNIEDFNISNFENITYTGESIVQHIILKNGTILLVEGTDYEIEYKNNKNVGIATVVITGKGNYTGTITKTFKIVAKDISNSSVAGVQNKSYNGQPLTQNIIIEIDGKKLNEGIDYAIDYKNNTNAGTATVVITGKGNYTGTITRTFKISAISFTNSKVSGIKTKEYTGGNLTQSIVVKYGNTILVKDKEYKVTYSNQKNPGRATIKITGIGNYTGTITKTFIIKPKKVSGFKVKEQKTDSIKLSWSKHTGVTGYKLYSYNYKKEKWEYVGKTSSTSYTIKNLKPGTTYKYRVRAYKTIDGTQYFGSYTSSIKTSTKTKTPSISKLTTKSKKVTIKWKKVTGASAYQIYISTSKNGKYERIKTITKGSTTSYTKTKLKKNKKYYFKIRTYRIIDGKKVYSSYSSVKSIKVK